MLRLFAGVFFAVFLCVGASHSGQRVLSVAVDPSWPPMEYIDADGELAGFSIDYLNAMAREAGFRVEFKIVPWEGIFNGLTGGEYDVVSSSVSITEDRKSYLDFSLPYYEVRQAVVAERESGIESLDDLSGLRIGVLIESTAHYLLNEHPDVDVVAYDDIAVAFTAMEAGSLEGAMCDDPVAANFVSEHEGEYSIALSVESDEPELYGFAVKKGRADVAELLDKGILAIRFNSVDAEIRAKWLSGGR